MLQSSPERRDPWAPRAEEAREPLLWASPPPDGRILLSMPTRWVWSPKGAAHGGPGPGPRHRTMRRQGVVPLYPAPEELEGAVKGRLEASAEGLRLLAETGDARLDLPSGSILVKVFHRNVVELHLISGARVLAALSEKDAEVLDVVSQAYL